MALRGFTLIELVIVVVIVAVIAAIAIPRLSAFNESALLNAGQADFRNFETALQNYYVDHEAWPADRGAGTYPPDLAGYYRKADWDRGPAMAKDWDWNPSWGLGHPNIAMWEDPGRTATWLQYDARFDDGSLASGLVQTRGGGKALCYSVNK